MEKKKLEKEYFLSLSPYLVCITQFRERIVVFQTHSYRKQNKSNSNITVPPEQSIYMYFT